MENIGICIIESDNDYANALAKSITRLYPGFAISLKTEADIEHLKRHFDISLISSSLSNEVAIHSNDNRDSVIILYDGTEELPPEKLLCIDKYSTCDDIVRYIMHKYAESSNKPIFINNLDEGNCEIVSFFATEGGAGTTSVSLGFARELAMYRGKKVLFLSREPFETISLCEARLSFDKAGGSAEYLYYFLKKEEKILARLRESLIIRDDFGVMRFIPSAKKNRLCELDESEFLQFVSHLSTVTAADTVVIDRGVWIGDYLPGQRLAYVMKADSTKCKSATEADLNIFGLSDEQADKLLLVENRPVRKIGGNSSILETVQSGLHAYTNKRIIQIEWDGSDFCKIGHGIQLSLTNIFGNSIKELADIFLNQSSKVQAVSEIEVHKNIEDSNEKI